jgi:hypothetical protein
MLLGHFQSCEGQERKWREIHSGKNETRLYFVDRSEEAEAMLIIVAFVLSIVGVGTVKVSQSFFRLELFRYLSLYSCQSMDGVLMRKD